MGQYGLRPALCAVLVFFLIADGSASRNDPLVVVFQAPAHFGPNATAEALDWVLVVFRDPTAANFAAHFVGPLEVENHTFLNSRIDNPIFTRTGLEPIPSRGPIAWSGDLDIELSANSGWSSLLIVADSIRIETSRADGRILAPGEGMPMVSDLSVIARGEYRNHYDLLDQNVRFETLPQAAQTRLDFEIDATGLSEVEWHNVTTHCPGTECPDGAKTWKISSSPVFIQTMPFLDWQMSDGHMSGGGSAWAVVAGGRSPSLTVDGTTRLPIAVSESCPSATCRPVEGQTLGLDGVVTLSSIEPLADEPGRIRASLDGDVQSARLDEESTDYSSLIGIPLVAAAATVGAAFVVWRLLAAIVARWVTDPLSNPVRSRLYQTILENPGSTHRELMRRLAIGNGALVHHLAVLQKRDFVSSYEDGNRRRFYENHGKFRTSWKAIGVLRDSIHKEMVSWIASHPGASQKEILAWAGEHGQSRTTTQERLARLLSAGVVVADLHGKRLAYRCSPMYAASGAAAGEAAPTMH